MSNVFDVDPERAALNKRMNRLIVDGFAAKAGTIGTFGRTGEQTPTNEALREQLSGALNELERARRAGDAGAIHFAEFQVERAREASRTGREQSSDDRPRDEQGRFVATEPAPSFDGDMHGRRPIAPPAGGLREETPNQLIRRAMEASRATRVTDGTIAGTGRVLTGG